MQNSKFNIVTNNGRQFNVVGGYILRKHKARKKMNKYSKTTIRTARRTKGSIPGDNVQTFLVKLLL